ncbi:MAG: S8 family peptidase [Candidatus Heimdallarchaeota archaeon]|nr:S8 family peptidase [Candidatus Heimdallarchaeota archaeon]
MRINGIFVLTILILSSLTVLQFHKEFTDKELIEKDHTKSRSYPLHPFITVDAALDWGNLTQRLGLDWLHTNGYTGNNVKVGIIDNGVDFLHDSFTGKSYVENSFAPVDEPSTESHGTPVVGVIYGMDGSSGTAPDITLVSAEMGSNIGDNEITGNITEAFEWLISQNVTVINTSFGGHGNWTELMNKLNENNILLVGSIGNDGYNSVPSGPSQHLLGIGVGAITENNLTETYSSRGPTDDFTSKPDVVAFGTVESTNVITGTGFYSGTSFASPMIVGGIASVIQALNDNAIDYNPGGIKAALMRSAKSFDGVFSQGAGLPNFTLMYEILRNANTVSSQQSVSYVPQSSFGEFDNLPAGLNTSLPFSLISSHDYTGGVTGNISSFLTFNTLVHHSDQPIGIRIPKGIRGYYEGNISINVNGEMDYYLFSTNITDDLVSRVAFHYYYSSDFVDGVISNLNKFNPLFSYLRSKAIWPELLFGEINEFGLERFDVIVMHNLFGPDLEDIEQFASGDISLLRDFVNYNGSLLITYQTKTDQILTDISSVNQLIEEFGFKANDANTQLANSPYFAELRNNTAVGRHAKTMRFNGGSIEGGLNLMNGKRGLVTSTDIHQGRVMVSSSVEWLYYSVIFSEDVLLYLSQREKIGVPDISFVDDYIEIDINSTSTPNLSVERFNYSENLVEKTEVNFTFETGSLWSISYTLEDGYTDLHIEMGEEYYNIFYEEHRELIVDKILPSITSLNNLTMNETGAMNLYFNFTENDEIVDIDIIVDGLLPLFIFEMNFTSSQITIPVEFDFFDKGWVMHNVSVTLTDLAGNNNTEFAFITLELPVGPAPTTSSELVHTTILLTEPAATDGFNWSFWGPVMALVALVIAYPLLVRKFGGIKL